MDVREFEQRRRLASTARGPIAYVDVGEGPATLFVHGVFMNGLLWRKAVAALSRERRAIAVDLPAHGGSPSGDAQDLSLAANADLLAALLDELGIESVDLVGNDTGGAVCQVFVARHRERVRTLTLTNCDAHDNLPPAAFKEGKERAARGELAAAMEDLGRRARSGAPVPELALGFAHPERVSADEARGYLGAFADPHRAREIQRFVVSTRVEDLLAAEEELGRFDCPTLIVWGTSDDFFELDWAHWLRDFIPGARKVVEVDGGKLFFPDERAAEFVSHLRRFLNEHSPDDAARLV